MKITRIHVDQHAIRHNRTRLDEPSLPVLTVKDYQQNRKCNGAVIRDPNTGDEILRIVYRPDQPLSCGARVWIETRYLVETTP